MEYEKTIWKNREVERPRTFRQQNNPDGTVTLIPEEGQIIEPGTPIIADNMNKIEDAIEGLFTSVSNGKQVVADAITGKGVPTSATDPFQQMADNIEAITTGEDTSDATATAGDILSGQTAYARGQKITGTIVRRTGHVNAQSISRSGTALRFRPQVGYYPGDTANSVQFSDPNWIAANIRSGVSIFGLAGSLIEGKPWASGTGNTIQGTYGACEIRTLTFRPSIVLIETEIPQSSPWLMRKAYWDGMNSRLNEAGYRDSTSIAQQFLRNPWTIYNNGFRTETGFGALSYPYNWIAFA